MTGWTLTLRQPPTLRLCLRGITPNALALLDATQVAALPLGHGNSLLPLGAFFNISPRSDDGLLLQGDLSRCDRVGWQLDGGQLTVRGPVGHHAGGAMRAGTLTIHGHAGDLAACEMAGGALTIYGNVGDFAAASLPGSMDGMRGGVLRVQGNAGVRFADRMRRGTALVLGDAGDFLASRLVAGTVAVAGRVGAHVGYGMRRGSLVLLHAPAVPATFVPAGADAPVLWQLLARDLARLGDLGTAGGTASWSSSPPSNASFNPFCGLAQRRIQRCLGDLAADGKGEIILPC